MPEMLMLPLTATKDNLLRADLGQSLTQQQFDAMHAGETRTKFKMIVDPATKKIYWLLRPDRGEGTRRKAGSPYQEINVGPTTIYSYRLSDARKAEYARLPEALGGDFHLKTMTLQSGAQRDPERD